MRENTIVTVLMRPRCRIPLGEPDEAGSNWKGLPPTVVPQSSMYADYSAVPLRPPKTEVRALAGTNSLFLRFDCALEDPTRLTARAATPLSELERAWVHIYPHNDSVERFRLEADFKGVVGVTRH